MSDEKFQYRVKPWMDKCFGHVISKDTVERNHRFLEEALELVQACECTADEAHQLVDYVFGRPAGDKPQEVGVTEAITVPVWNGYGFTEFSILRSSVARGFKGLGYSFLRPGGLGRNAYACYGGTDMP